jgi:hypothetical protein
MYSKDAQDIAEEYAKAQRSRFRFKTHSKRPHNERGHERRRYRSKEATHRTKRHKASSPPAPDPEQQFDSEALFRESLFDAMADDEGAQFWEGVYGQPIPKLPMEKEDPVTGRLEKMTEEEYAAYVRAEMYKKTHAHLLEERERREKARKEHAKMNEEARRKMEEEDAFRQQVEESLRRGQERKSRAQQAAAWKQRWSDYVSRWDALGDAAQGSDWHVPWPVLSGKRQDVSKEEVEAFFINAPTAGEPDRAELLKTLKAERVRWHPDKIQQKLGGHGVDEAKIQGVTAVFQIIDTMWNEMKSRS